MPNHAQVTPAQKCSDCEGVPIIKHPHPPKDPWDFVFQEQVPARFYYFLDQFTVTNPSEALDQISNFRAVAGSECKWQRVFLGDTVTGRPNSFIQLWRVPTDVPLDQQYARLKQSQISRDFFGSVSSFERELLYPMTYDPKVLNEPDPLASSILDLNQQRDTPLAMILVNHISVKSGAMQAFSCAKQEHFIPFVKEAPYNWRLIGAASKLTGSPGQVVQCWLLPQPNSLVQTMRAIAQNSGYRVCLLPCIESERQELYELRAGA